jgi:hypothetical protein
VTTALITLWVSFGAVFALVWFLFWDDAQYHTFERFLFEWLLLVVFWPAVLVGALLWLIALLVRGAQGKGKLHRLGIRAIWGSRGTWTVQNGRRTRR